MLHSLVYRCQQPAIRVADNITASKVINIGKYIEGKNALVTQQSKIIMAPGTQNFLLYNPKDKSSTKRCPV